MGHGPELFGKIYEQGETVFHPGEPGTEMVVIQAGAVEISGPHQGRRSLSETVGVFGEISLIHTHRRSAITTAITRTRWPALSRDVLLQKISDTPDVVLKGLSRIVRMIRRIHAMIDGAVVEKIRRLVAARFNNAFINWLTTDLSRRHRRRGRSGETGNRLTGGCVRRFDPRLRCAAH